MKKPQAVRVGVVGAGAISDIYLKNMSSRFSILQVEAICAHTPAHAQSKAAEYGLRACTLEEMLADPGLDLIVNLTPVPAHYDVIRRALLAGKHVYTEKVITDDPTRAKELAALAEQRGLYLGAAPDTFLGAALQTARAALDAGCIGTVTSCAVAANRCYDLLLSRFGFLRQPGGGVCLDYGVYYLTALISLLGPVTATVARVEAPFPTHVNCLPESPDFGKVMDTPNESEVSALLRFASGATGTFHLNADTGALHDQAFFALYGTKGILYLPDPNQFGGAVRLLSGEEERTLPVRHAFADNSRGLGPAELAWALRSGRPCRAGSALSCHVLEVLAAMLQSGQDGAWHSIASTCMRPRPLPLPDGDEESCLMA